MTPVVPGLTVRDSQILELLRSNVSVARVIEIGRHRGTWNSWHVGSVVGQHFDPKPRADPKPVKQRKKAECGTLSGYSRHTRRKEPVCDACAAVKREYMRERAAKKRAEGEAENGPAVRSVWAPAPFTGRATDVSLSPARLDVLGELCRGLSNRRIGAQLGISEDTVKSHLKEILAALGAVDRTHAVVMVLSGQVRILGEARTERAA